jgi:hypothetical protein
MFALAGILRCHSRMGSMISVSCRYATAEITVRASRSTNLVGVVSCSSGMAVVPELRAPPGRSLLYPGIEIVFFVEGCPWTFHLSTTPPQ